MKRNNSFLSSRGPERVRLRGEKTQTASQIMAREIKAAAAVSTWKAQPKETQKALSPKGVWREMEEGEGWIFTLREKEKEKHV